MLDVRAAFTTISFCMLTSAGASAGTGKPPAPLAPSSKWQLDYGMSECRLLRSFGEGRDRITLQLGRGYLEDVVEMALASARIPSSEGYVDVSVGTTTVEKVPGMRARGFDAGRKTSSVLRFRPDQDLPRALLSDAASGKPTVLKVAFVHGYAARLELGIMKNALASLDRCMDDLVKGWGLDPNEQRARRSAPIPIDPPSKWFGAGDFPANLNHAGVGAIVVIRLMTGSDGAVTGCTVAKSGGDEAFETLTCRLAIARARFRPAIGANGEPIASAWIQRIDWRPGQPMFRFIG